MICRACAILALGAALGRGAEPATRWWPVQKEPRVVLVAGDYAQYPPVTGADGRPIPGVSNPHHMLVQSVAGLAALAVNEGRGDEMVWIDPGPNPDYRDWYRRLLDRGRYEVRAVSAPWDLVRHFAERGIVRGYALYRHDAGARPLNTLTATMDESVNVATSVAGLLGAVLVAEELEPKARELGLAPLFDARGKTEAWCFETYRNQFSRRLACFQDPKVPHGRALAIAQKAIMLYGTQAPAEAVMAWLEPLSPIAGWPGGDEFEATLQSTVYGHVQTATNWCLNLPVLMAGAESRTPRPARRFAPASIDWHDSRPVTAFVMSDGDNVQWIMGAFFRSQNGWWNSPDRGRFDIGWSCPSTHLAQVCTEAQDYLAETQSAHCWMVEWGGGYYYPDRFAEKRPERWELLARHARRTWAFMRATGTDVVAYNVTDVDSPEALQAFRAIADAMDGVLGILAFQYAPYEGGEGRVFWVGTARGDEVPVVTASYSLWGNTDRPRSGTPAKLARLLDADPEPASWSVVHCWSFFRPAPGAGVTDHAEDMPQDDAEAKGGTRGLTPVRWCVDRLRPERRVVSPQEMLWRLRMRHAPDATRRALEGAGAPQP